MTALEQTSVSPPQAAIQLDPPSALIRLVLHWWGKRSTIHPIDWRFADRRSEHEWAFAKITGDWYRPIMSNKLNALLERLKAQQRDLILAMAEYGGLPANSDLRQVSELENVIAAVEAVAAEEALKRR